MADGNSDVMQTVSRLLDRVSTEGDVVVRDVDGKEYRLRLALPARRQVKVFEALKALLLVPAIQSLAQPGLTSAGVLDAIGTLATDPEVAEHLGRAFSAAWPKATDGQDPLDLFAIEELFNALLPVVVRFIQRGGEAFSGLVPPQG